MERPAPPACRADPGRNVPLRDAGRLALPATRTALRGRAPVPEIAWGRR